MNQREALAFIERLGDHFPNWAKTLTPERAANLAQDWTLIMGDLEANIVAVAVAQLLSEPREFPPIVGHVNVKARALLAEARGECEMDVGEAWRLVCGAVEGFGNGAAWNSEKRALIPAAAIKAAEDFGLMRIRMRLDENAGTDFAQFRDIYNAVAARQRAARNTSPQITAMLESVTARLRLNAPRAERRAEVNNQ